MDFSGIHLRLLKLTAAEFATLQPTEPPSQTTGTVSIAIRIRSPEIPEPSPVRPTSHTIPESPSTPTPVQSRRPRPLGSPIKQISGPAMSQLGAIHPDLLNFRNGSMSIAESSNGGSPNREEWEEDEEESQENTKDVAGALVITSQSEDMGGSQISEVKKPRLKAEKLVYDPCKKTRENYYRTTSERLKATLKKIGTKTACYGILYIHRCVFLFHHATDYAGM